VPGTLARRRLLASAAALPLLLGTAGCQAADLFAGPDPLAARPRLSPTVIALQEVIAAEEDLIRRYRPAVGRPPGPPELAPLLGQHEQHLARLRDRLLEPPGARPPRGQAIPGPPHAEVTVARLRAAEQASAAALVQRLATAEPSVAQLFASIAACHVTHAAVLSGLGG